MPKEANRTEHRFELCSISAKAIAIGERHVPQRAVDSSDYSSDYWNDKWRH